LFALTGTATNLAYNATTHFFALQVAPGNSGAATVGISLAPPPVMQIAPGAGGNVQISWPAAAAGYALQKATNLAPPVDWKNASDPVISSNGQNAATVTDTNSTIFYRLTSP